MINLSVIAKIIELLGYLITTAFLLVILSYYFLFFIRRKKSKGEKFSSLTVIIPAHNEENFIEECIKSVLNAGFNGRKQVIVVDDGSSDNTVPVVKKFGGKIDLIRTKHQGKSKSINTALKQAKGELIAIVDADSIIEKNSLDELSSVVSQKGFAGATCPVKVKNRKRFLGLWMHIEQIYNSLMRDLLSKVNANITTPGPLSMYRKKNLFEVDGFSEKGYSEDVDITIKLIRKGYKIGFSGNTSSSTNMPSTLNGFVRQRFRFARGLVFILKNHLKYNKKLIDIYTLPILVFSYIQAVIMSVLLLYQVFSGYFTYFFSKGMYFDLHVLRFFLEWFSIVGFVKWFFGIFTGSTPLTVFTLVGIISSLLTYPLYFIAILKFDRKIDVFHLIPIAFMFPFWLVVMVIYTLSFPEFFIREQRNIWEKVT